MVSEKNTKITITLDASNWQTPKDFYVDYCASTRAPKWFGNNLDALEDSLRGEICELTPEKIIIKNLSKKIIGLVGEKFFTTVNSICLDNSVELEIYFEFI
jgi:RNAse (barnase) inhibitor barstar